MASYDTPKTILLRGQPMSKEAAAGGSITPGMLLRRSAVGTVVAHSNVALLMGPFLVARELEFAGGGIDDVYESGDTVPYHVARAGDEMYMLLADGANVAFGAALQSDGAGALTAQTSTNPTRAIALEAVDNSAGGAPARIKVEVIQ